MTDAEFTKLMHHFEQDEAAALHWWGQTVDGAHNLVWKCIQRRYADPVVEMMTRFAQLGFRHVAIAAERRRRDQEQPDRERPADGEDLEIGGEG